MSKSLHALLALPLLLGAASACATPALAASVVPASPVSDAVPAGARAEVEASFGRWAAALATRDPATVTALFAPGGVLAPTVSNEVRTTPARIEAYFVDFLKLAPRPTLNQRTIVMVDTNTAVEAGVWTFDLTRDGQPNWVTARYSFVWEKTGAGWQIQLLHSSLMPEGQTTRPPAMSPPPPTP